MLTRRKRSESDTRKILLRKIFDKNEIFKQDYYEINQLNTKNYPIQIQQLIILNKAKTITETVCQNKELLQEITSFLQRNKTEFSNFVKQQLLKIKNISDPLTSEIVTGIITGFIVDAVLQKSDI